MMASVCYVVHVNTKDKLRKSMFGNDGEETGSMWMRASRRGSNQNALYTHMKAYEALQGQRRPIKMNFVILSLLYLLSFPSCLVKTFN